MKIKRVKYLNKKTLKAIEDAEKGKGLTVSKDAKDLFKKLGILKKKSRQFDPKNK